MSYIPPEIRYELSLDNSEQGVAFYYPKPATQTTLFQAIDYLQEHPNDEFMYRHALHLLLGAASEKLCALPDLPVVQALLTELKQQRPQLASTIKTELAPQQAARYSPCVQIRSELLPDKKIHQKWSQIFAANIFQHKRLPILKKEEIPFDQEKLPQPFMQNPDIIKQNIKLPSPCPRRPAIETYKKAMAVLYATGCITGPEMRHQASLSPWGLQRQWQMDVNIQNGRHNYKLKGIQTSYGRGLDMESARASLAMEIVERCSSFAGFNAQGVVGTKQPYPLIQADLKTMQQNHSKVLDPQSMNLEVPYDGRRLWWMQVKGKNKHKEYAVWIPAQLVFLFANLDEPALFSAVGSTGLASGNTEQEAKVSAILEILERDSEAVSPFRQEKCFRLHAQDDSLADLLQTYKQKHIDVCFQEITSHIGVPCYKCFVMDSKGQIIKGTGASLNARQAVISALTETPYPYPVSPSSMPGPQDIPTINLENLQDYSTGSAQGDLMLLENIIFSAGYDVIYTELTRKDLNLPVFRAHIPGLELVADFDDYSRLSPRLFANVWQMQQ